MHRPDEDASAPNPWAPPDSTPLPPERPASAAPPAYAPPSAWGQPQYGPPPQGPPHYPPPYGTQPWGWPAPPDPAARRRSRIRAVAALGGVVVLLLAGLGTSVVLENRREGRVQAEVAALLPELQAFIEQERGLPFREDVDVEVLDDDEFLEALYEPDPSAPKPREDRDSERTLKTLGLLDPDVDLDEAVETSLDEGVVGFYDPVADRLAVRGQEIDPFVQLVLVHELTHALQDQHFDVDRPELDESDDERSLAFRSLVEGDAVRVETAWLEAQPRDVQEELAEIFESGGSGTGEPVVEAVLGFPYYAGPELVTALLDSGGREALDAAFREPPTTVEQVLDPAAGAGEQVPAPTAEGETVDAGVLGVLTLALLTGADPLEPGPERAWDGDRYVTTEQDGVTCTVADIASDDPTSGRALRDRLQEWAATQDEASVAEGPDGALRLSACIRG